MKNITLKRASALLLGASLACAGRTSRAADAASALFSIDLTRDSKPISRYIYGVNSRLGGAYSNLTLTRMGGNRWTAYNWINNASNAGSDWTFQNDNLLGGDGPGEAVAAGLDNAAAEGAAAIVTIPMAGYVSADKKGDGDVHRSGADYLKTRFRESLPRKGAAFTLKPDADSPRVYQDEFVNWLKTKYLHGATDLKTAIFFSMDNEPDLWASTHKEVHPEPPTYAEMVRRTTDYATAIKQVEPKALIFGPVSYGWQGYATLQNAPDAAGRDFLDFYLQQMAQAQKTGGKRLLDVLDVHWYPEATGGGKRISGQETDPALIDARLQAPRSLWDASYTETSWITQWSTKGPIKLIPRLFEKIRRNYPGTRLAVTEYNFGGGAHISGGIAVADVVGIFGREGVFAAAEWPMAKEEPFVAAALAMYRNFDGKKGSFGDTSVFAETNHVAETSVFASTDSAQPGKLVIVALNKTNHAIEAEFRLAHGGAYRSAEVYQLTSEKAEPRTAPAISLSKPAGLHASLPPYSVTTLRLVAAK